MRPTTAEGMTARERRAPIAPTDASDAAPESAFAVGGAVDR